MKKEIAALSFATLAAAGCTPEKTSMPAPSPVEISASPTATPESVTIKLNPPLTSMEIKQHLAAAQKGMVAVSTKKMKEFVSIIDTYGYTQSDLPNTKRLVVKASHGVVFTDELTYENPVGSGDNRLMGVTVYMRKPGEAHATHVITDGNESGEGIIPPLDGKVDQIIGYTPYSEAGFHKYAEKYSDISAGFLNQLDMLAAKGITAQEDFTRAVDVTTSRY